MNFKVEAPSFSQEKQITWKELQLWPSTRGYPGEQNKPLLKGFVRLRRTCSPLSGLHVLIAMQNLLNSFYSFCLDSLVWFNVCLGNKSENIFKQICNCDLAGYRVVSLIRNSPPPSRTTIGPQALAYCRVSGGCCFLWARYPCSQRCERRLHATGDIGVMFGPIRKVARVWIVLGHDHDHSDLDQSFCISQNVFIT